jgi:type IV secretion system protein VirB1
MQKLLNVKKFLHICVLGTVWRLLCSPVYAAEGSVKSLLETCATTVHPVTMAAVVRGESTFNPYAINVNHKTYKLPAQPKNKEEAIKTASWLQSKGYNFDSGLGQINSTNLKVLGMSITDLFDPCRNLQGAATVLTDCYERAAVSTGEGQKALHKALSCYNTGNFQKGFTNGYVQKIAGKTPSKIIVPALADREIIELSPATKSESVPVRLAAKKVENHQRETEQDKEWRGDIFAQE